MEKNEHIDKELEELSPLLRSLKKQRSGFKVPADYFDQLPDVVMDRINEEEQATSTETAPIVSSFLDRLFEQLQILLQPRYALAFASVAVLLIAGIYFFNAPQNTQVDVLAEISAEELEDYVMSNVEEFEMEVLLEEMEESELDIPSSEDAIPPMDDLLDDIIEDLSDEELEELM